MTDALCNLNSKLWYVRREDVTMARRLKLMIKLMMERIKNPKIKRNYSV